MAINLTYDPSDDDLDSAAADLDGTTAEQESKQEQEQQEQAQHQEQEKQHEQSQQEDLEKAFSAVKALTDRICNKLGVDVLSAMDLMKLYQAHQVLDAQFNFKPIIFPPKIVAICVAGGIAYEVVSPRIDQFKRNKEASTASAENTKAKQEREANVDVSGDGDVSDVN